MFCHSPSADTGTFFTHRRHQQKRMLAMFRSIHICFLVCAHVLSFEIPHHRVRSSVWKSLAAAGAEELPVEYISPSDLAIADEGNGAPHEESGNIHIPTTGVSISDEMEEANKDRYTTKLVPIESFPGVAQLITEPVVSHSVEPLRYLVALSPPKNDPTCTNDYVMVDIPPFSMNLLGQIQSFLGPNGRLRAILISNRNAIHYDEAPAVYSLRRADLDQWKKRLPEVPVFGYRMDIPRDCRFGVAQVLDGYGPFALSEDGNYTFVETGRPLTVNLWDENTAASIMNGETDVDEIVKAKTSTNDVDFTPEAIREREEGKRILAIYTPGHTFGSVSYVFPEVGVCCSGFTIPCEDPRTVENLGSDNLPGPMLDYRGFVTTTQDQHRQMDSARMLINTYTDRFSLVLPSRGDPFQLAGDTESRKEVLLGSVAQFELLGEIYSQLGISRKRREE